MTRLQITAAGAAVVLMIPTVAAGAAAAPMAEKEKAGTCSAGARWELDIERERRAVYIDFSIEDGPAREQWTVRIDQDGQRILTRSVTADRDGDADVSRRIADTSGPDRFVVRATSASGQVCRAAMSI